MAKSTPLNVNCKKKIIIIKIYANSLTTTVWTPGGHFEYQQITLFYYPLCYVSNNYTTQVP